jgi:phospholipase D1/2
MADRFTAQLTPDTITTISGQYFDLDQPFAVPRYQNECTPYTTGRDYMKAVADAIRGAKKFIFITGWQLDYDVELDNRGDPKHPGRLSELLADALQRGVHVRILCYDSIARVLDTHDDNTQAILSKLDKGKGSLQVMLQNPNTGRAASADIDLENPNYKVKDSNTFFSHHQKSVVVDGHVAFLGGLDLAYGRWDTNAFDVVIDRSLHVINDAYNMQIACARSLTPFEVKLTKEVGGRPGFQTPFKAAYDEKLLDETYQPRQPWQDVAVGINGPAAFDVFVNFVLRWNSFAGSGTNSFDGSMNSAWFEKSGSPDLLVDPLKHGNGSATVQICRSASSAQLRDELQLWDTHHKYVCDDWKQPDKKRRQIIEAARKDWSSQHQTSIRDAMIQCIRSAQAFIYIENQFFMSNCGSDERGSPCPSSNSLIGELANAIGKAIYAQRPFHVFLVLPEHPEGMLEEDGPVSQGWWALQGVKRANNSLVNRINATILAKNRKAWGLEHQPNSNEAIRVQLEAHGMQDKWREYLTVLNLRNFGHTDSTVVTEMIYVHSKLLIVDDAVAILGSANINDRSLNGNGDTELAAVIVDDAGASINNVGQGIKVITRKFAKDLRIRLWEKHLGMSVDQRTTGVGKQSAPMGIKLDQPLDVGTIAGIQKLSAVNRAAYNEVFTHTPRNAFKTMTEGRQAFKVHFKDRNGKQHQKFSASARPDLQPAFMSAPGAHAVVAAINKLSSSVKGFWVEMPLDWGSGQVATPKAPVSSTMIARAEAPPKEGKVSA